MNLRKVNSLLRCRQRKPPVYVQRAGLLLSILLFITISLFLFGAGLCGDFFAADKRQEACQAYLDKLYREPFCEELCSHKYHLHSFKCISGHPWTVTAVRDGNVINIRYPEPPKKSFTWQSQTKKMVYPKKWEFFNIIKLYLMINYNVTLKDKMSKFPFAETIDEDNHKEMDAYWSLLNCHYYVMSKLFEDEELFPKVLGNCGPLYITEGLIAIESVQDMKVHRKQRYFKKLFEYVLRLESMKPDPLKMCKIDVNEFGFTRDFRLKSHRPDLILSESQLNKQLANGVRCATDADCKWHDCLGICDREKLICNAAQKSSNVKLLCDYAREHPEAFPELLTDAVHADWHLYTQHCWQWNSTVRNV